MDPVDGFVVGGTAVPAQVPALAKGHKGSGSAAWHMADGALPSAILDDAASAPTLGTKTRIWRKTNLNLSTMGMGNKALHLKFGGKAHETVDLW